MLCSITSLTIILSVTWGIKRLSLLFVPPTWRRNGDYYEKNSTQNIFSFREKIYTEKRSGVGSGSIKLEVSNVLHTDGSNNVIISEFERGDIMYDPNKWDHGSHYYNTTKKTYAKNTKYDGQVTYLLTCPDAIPASAAESARISLATN